jgi:uncharacterized protein
MNAFFRMMHVQNREALVEALQRNPTLANTPNPHTGSMPLCDATRQHLEAAVLALLHAGADPNNVCQGRAALDIAAYHDAVACGEALLTFGADPNISDEIGRTPVMTAAKFASMKMLDLLLSHAADVTRTDHHGRTVLHWAATGQHSDANVIKAFFRTKPVVTCPLRHPKERPIACAARSRRLSARRCFCGLCRRQPRARHVMKTGVVEDERASALATAMTRGSKSMNDDRLRNVAMAIDEHDVSRLRDVLLSGVDANARMDHPNQLPLHAAVHEVVEGAPMELVRQLIDFNADVNMPSALGFLPLGIAVSEGRNDLVKLLLEAGANPNARNAEGELPLHIAVDRGDVDACILLLKHGAAETMNEWSSTTALTPLGSAARNLNLSMVALLRSNGAHLSARDDDDKTARQRLPVRNEENADVWDKLARLLQEGVATA